MKKRLLKGLALAGCLFAVSPASAYVFDFDVTDVQGGASGSYHVTLTTPDMITWTFTVTGNDDGNGSTGNPLGVPVKHDADQISFTFFDGSLLGPTINTASLDPLTGTDTTAGPYVATLWDPVLPGSNARFNNTTGASGSLNAFGANNLVGGFSLLSGDSDVIRVSIQDGGQQWTQVVNVTPEPASVALLLSGGAPLGLLLRRRRNLVA